jgi:hypothetical protein
MISLDAPLPAIFTKALSELSHFSSDGLLAKVQELHEQTMEQMLMQTHKIEGLARSLSSNFENSKSLQSLMSQDES